MKETIIFIIGLMFSILFVFQICHFIKDEGDSLHAAVMRAESSICLILCIGSWILFIVQTIHP
jgi:hypothetical protein